ncbi:MAG: low specificity L-threonine aldolase [Alphaproteobacteria bacterium]|nr:low specificity L-threonine aldolase [Alphaproteobacteria bacterium]
MNFASDNAAPAHPAILEAMARANAGALASYGGDALTARAVEAVRTVFERDCDVLFVATGTAANAIALAALTPAWGAVFCHRHAHVAEDEAGAPEFYTGGAKLLLLDGPHGKIAPDTLRTAAAGYSRGNVHGAQPFAVTITQATESGASWTPAEVGGLCEAARGAGLKVHMDGARFANALAFTGASPADVTWRAGVDVVSFGATKNGALAAEAIVSFDPAVSAVLPHLRKRAGHLVSKHRLLAAQMAAYLDDGLWMRLAAHANAQARSLASALTAAGATLLHPVEANEVFVRAPEALAARLRAAGAAFHPWASDGPDAYRFVASWATTADEVAALAAVARG